MCAEDGEDEWDDEGGLAEEAEDEGGGLMMVWVSRSAGCESLSLGKDFGDMGERESRAASTASSPAAAADVAAISSDSEMTGAATCAITS